MPGYLPKPPVCVLQRDHPLAQGLVGAWAFFEGGGGKRVRDLSGRGNHGMAQADGKWVGGAHGWAMDFDGVSDYVDASGVSGTIQDDIVGSVAMWVKLNDLANAGAMFSACDDTDANGWVVLYLHELGDWFAGCYENNSNQYNHAFIGAPQPVAGEWNHLIFVQDATELALYVNAHKYNQAAGAINPGAWFGTVSGINNVPIGRLVTASGGALPFDGAIDDMRIYNRALNAAEVAAIYHDPFAIYRPRRVQLSVPAIKRGFISFGFPRHGCRFGLAR